MAILKVSRASKSNGKQKNRVEDPSKPGAVDDDEGNDQSMVVDEATCRSPFKWWVLDRGSSDSPNSGPKKPLQSPKLPNNTHTSTMKPQHQQQDCQGSMSESAEPQTPSPRKLVGNLFRKKKKLSDEEKSWTTLEDDEDDEAFDDLASYGTASTTMSLSNSTHASTSRSTIDSMPPPPPPPEAPPLDYPETPVQVYRKTTGSSLEVDSLQFTPSLQVAYTYPRTPYQSASLSKTLHSPPSSAPARSSTEAQSQSVPTSPVTPRKSNSLKLIPEETAPAKKKGVGFNLSHDECEEEPSTLRRIPSIHESPGSLKSAMKKKRLSDTSDQPAVADPMIPPEVASRLSLLFPIPSVSTLGDDGSTHSMASKASVCRSVSLQESKQPEATASCQEEQEKDEDLNKIQEAQPLDDGTGTSLSPDQSSDHSSTGKSEEEHATEMCSTSSGSQSTLKTADDTLEDESCSGTSLKRDEEKHHSKKKKKKKRSSRSTRSVSPSKRNRSVSPSKRNRSVSPSRRARSTADATTFKSALSRLEQQHPSRSIIQGEATPEQVSSKPSSNTRSVSKIGPEALVRMGSRTSILREEEEQRSKDKKRHSRTRSVSPSKSRARSVSPSKRVENAVQSMSTRKSSPAPRRRSERVSRSSVSKKEKTGKPEEADTKHRNRSSSLSSRKRSTSPGDRSAVTTETNSSRRSRRTSSKRASSVTSRKRSTSPGDRSQSSTVSRSRRSSSRTSRRAATPPTARLAQSENGDKSKRRSRSVSQRRRCTSPGSGRSADNKKPSEEARRRKRSDSCSSRRHASPGRPTSARSLRSKRDGDDESTVADCDENASVVSTKRRSKRHSTKESKKSDSKKKANDDDTNDPRLVQEFERIVADLERLVRSRRRKANKKKPKSSTKPDDRHDQQMSARVTLTAALEKDKWDGLKKTYNLEDNDMMVVRMHAQSCQQLNECMRWDLIFQILLPDLHDPLGVSTHKE